jgi:hypothetical protein
VQPRHSNSRAMKPRRTKSTKNRLYTGIGRLSHERGWFRIGLAFATEARKHRGMEGSRLKIDESRLVANRVR